jgi:hypothetical protein
LLQLFAYRLRQLKSSNQTRPNTGHGDDEHSPR